MRALISSSTWNPSFPKMNETIQHLLKSRSNEIRDWLEAARKGLPSPVYSSYDIRNNGVKAAVVDSNLFPGGFNNLDEKSQKRASSLLAKHLAKYEKKSILIIPEAHTRNKFYLSSLNTLKSIAENAGYKVVLGTLREDVMDTLEVEDMQGKKLVLEKMSNDNGKLQTKSFSDGLVLLNNDFSVKAPKLLEGVSMPILPPLELGWVHRRKFNHFRHYCKTVNDFAKHFEIDNWLLCPITKEVNDVDFSSRKNIDKVAAVVDEMIIQLKAKHESYGIPHEPYVFVKDNSGTYGMGVITVQNGKQLVELNTKGRQKMTAGKQRSIIDSVVVQEGIATCYETNEGPAEPVLYAVSGSVVGGFMRVHPNKNNQESLSSPGVKFDTLLMDKCCSPMGDCINHNELPMFELLAAIAGIAIGLEMDEI